jgi:hypothetical protein
MSYVHHSTIVVMFCFNLWWVDACRELYVHYWRSKEAKEFEAFRPKSTREEVFGLKQQMQRNHEEMMGRMDARSDGMAIDDIPSKRVVCAPTTTKPLVSMEEEMASCDAELQKVTLQAESENTRSSGASSTIPDESFPCLPGHRIGKGTMCTSSYTILFIMYCT